MADRMWVVPGESAPTVAFAGVVATERSVESLPLAPLGDFVRGRILGVCASDSTRQVEGLFKSLLAEAFEV